MMHDEILIEPNRGFKHYWRDIWRYRELFYILAWRDILVRYKQTVIGVAWALIRPFVTMIVFTIVFNKVAKLEAPGAVPYPLLVFAAMLPWQFFSTALSESSNSLVGNANLISKVYFPRMIVPAGSVITSFVDFLITLRADGAVDALVRLPARLADPDPAAVHRPGLRLRLRRRPVALRPERQVPRFPLRHSVHRPVRSLRFAGRFQQRQDSGKLAPALFPQPNGRRHRRLPLGAPPRRSRVMVAERSDLCGSDLWPLSFRHLVFPPHGTTASRM